MKSFWKKQHKIEVDHPDPPSQCKRCGTLYHKRWSENPIYVWMDEVAKCGDGHEFRPDEEMLLTNVTPQAFCPRCEITLKRKRVKLLDVIKEKGF